MADLRTPERAKWVAREVAWSGDLPYPPSLLPARSWRAIMGRLDQHFGADASLDPKAVADLTAFLHQHAGPGHLVHHDATLRALHESSFEDGGPPHVLCRRRGVMRRMRSATARESG